MLRKLLSTIVLLFATLLCSGQIHPVQVSVRLVPPYSVYLGDYAADGQLQVTILQRDMSEPEYALRLRMEVQLGSSVIMRTSQQFNPPPLTVAPGMPVILTADDLLPYLDPRNLDFVGYSKTQYEKTKSLPEGAYTIRFTAFDYYRQDVAVSLPGQSFYFLAKADPPMLTMPYNGQRMSADPSDIIRFSWLPRNTASVNSSLSTVYRLQLYEVLPEGQNPNTVAQTRKPVFTTETDQPYYLYTPADPPLEPGVVYAWRVQAVDLDGRDAFANSGFSEVFSFSCGTPAAEIPPLTPISITKAQATGYYSAEATWEAGTYESYTFSYRKTGSSDWLTSTLTATTTKLEQLEPNATYECRVQGHVGGYDGPPSELVQLKTPEQKPHLCGDPAELPKRELGEPMPSLSRGDIIRAGYFLVRVSEASGSGGRFTGKGEVFIPFIGNAKLAVSFNNSYVNTFYELTEGEVVADGIPVEEWIKQQVDREGGVGSQTPKGDAQPEFTVAKPDDITVKDKNGNPIVPDPSNPDAEPQGPFTIEVKDENGKVHEYPVEQLPATITDSEGNTYRVGEDGKVQQTAKAGGGGAFSPTPDQLENLSVTNARVSFEKADDLAFDVLRPDYQGDYRSVFEVLDDNTRTTTYPVPFKLMEAGKPGTVRAVVELLSKKVDTSMVRFVTGKNLQLLPLKVDQLDAKRYAYTLELPPVDSGDGLDVYAMVTPQQGQHYSIGKLRAVAYARKSFKVVLVPVGGSYALEGVPTAAEQALRQAYAPLAVDFSVSVASEVFSGVAEGADPRDWSKQPLSVYGSGMLATATKDMRQLVAAYKAQATVDENTAYLFVLPKSDSTTVGDMPRGSRFGFLFDDQVRRSGDGYGWLIAHELGHGLFTLRHSWSYTGDDRSKLADNLMSYHSGTTLTKYQWDRTHNPETVVDIWKSDEEGMRIERIAINENFILQDADLENYAFLSPNGVAIVLPKDTYRVQFNEDGAVMRFDVYNSSIFKTESYAAVYAPVRQYFYGYIKESEFNEIKIIAEQKGINISPSESQELINQYQLKVEPAPKGKKIVAVWKKFEHGRYWDCIFKGEWINEVEGKREKPFTPPLEKLIEFEILKYGQECFDPITMAGRLGYEVKQGIGRDYLLSIPMEIVPIDEDQLFELIQLANYLSDECKNKKVVFYREKELPNEYILKDRMSKNTKEYFAKNEIITIKAFKNHFKVKDYAGDVDIIFSDVDLWEGIPRTIYNKNSVDYASFKLDLIEDRDSYNQHLEFLIYYIDYIMNEDPQMGNHLEKFRIKILKERFNYDKIVGKYTSTEYITACYAALGFYDKYVYKLADLKKRKEIKMNNSQLIYSISSNESDGLAEPIHSQHHYEQYYARHKTDKSYFLGVDYFDMVQILSDVSFLDNYYTFNAELKSAGVKERLRLALDRRNLKVDNANIRKNIKQEHIMNILTSICELADSEGAEEFLNSLYGHLKGKEENEWDFNNDLSSLINEVLPQGNRIIRIKVTNSTNKFYSLDKKSFIEYFNSEFLKNSSNNKSRFAILGLAEEIEVENGMGKFTIKNTELVNFPR